MTANSSRIWFITGASTGFGRLLAEELLKRGERVAATARDIAKVEDLARQYPGKARAFTLDVTRPAEIEAVARQAIEAFGHIDVLVNNAGYGLNGAIEEVSEEEFEPMFQTNIYGLIRTTRAFLPHFRVAAQRAHLQFFLDRRTDRQPGVGLLQRDQVCGGGVQRGAGRGDEAARGARDG